MSEATPASGWPGAPARAGTGEMVALNAYWLGLSFMWNGLHALVLPVVLLAFAPEALKNTYLGLLTFAGLMIATAVQPLAGTLSDGWRSRWGRRRPLITAGTVLDLVFLAVIALAPGLWWLAAAYLGLQVASNLAHGPLQALLPDRVPAHQHGRASAIKNLFDTGGLVAASLLVGNLLPPGTRQPVAAVAAIAGVLVVGAVITLAGTREAPSQSPPAPGTARHPAGRPAAAASDWRSHTAFWRMNASRFTYLLGIYGIQAFALYYMRDVMRVPDPAAATGNLLAAIALNLMLFAFIGGWLTDRLGPRRVQVFASLVSAVGCGLLLAARTPGLLLFFGSILGLGIGLFLTSNWTLANRVMPVGEAGKYLGLTNLASAGAGALVRLEGPVIDALNAAVPGAFWGYSLLFGLGVVVTLVSAALVPRE